MSTNRSSKTCLLINLSSNWYKSITGLLCIDYQTICYTIPINPVINYPVIYTQNVHPVINLYWLAESAIWGTKHNSTTYDYLEINHVLNKMHKPHGPHKTAAVQFYEAWDQNWISKPDRTGCIILKLLTVKVTSPFRYKYGKISPSWTLLQEFLRISILTTFSPYFHILFYGDIRIRFTEIRKNVCNTDIWSFITLTPGTWPQCYKTP